MNRFWFRLALVGIALSMGAVVASAQTPTFSVWVTEVNDTPCASCPTQNLPSSQVNPGDKIRIEFYVEGWDDTPINGVCSGQPPVGGASCRVGTTGACSGRHCSDTGASAL